MTTTRRTMQATVDQVNAVLADGECYAYWVVLTRQVKRVDGHWPGPGTKLDHSFGLGPFHVHGDTEVLEVCPGQLVLKAKAYGVGAARVSVSLEPSGGQTTATLDEDIIEPACLTWLNPLVAPLVRLRNIESLRRLEALATQRGRPEPAGAAMLSSRRRVEGGPGGTPPAPDGTAGHGPAGTAAYL